ncbi:ATP-binding cassette domain-containing protein [Legionella pneumophila serogroup 1]|uniref:ATP-binding cassette domain-containing protein n=2 Tax=Legionella pneumophila TaxID=446 RepID=UPI000480C254|nr:ATP-binding cassette domain-containing protein [Legionella pneumophila]AMV14778.1 ABC transporter ATP-binding protein uup [Legionella pneumophila]ANN92973.1 ABC transporter ATP-binding protein [Legionella pneumophila]MCH9061683.1 ATP-binding cassette domain-containing protein [Legionella pneumophila serogroup 1]MCH9064723.1 ATP-binding cassette domain-containing protein [Legionella pneumophila serogroup 1]MCH9067765.1 ATP-binding cassette domain-containing protein [Legionella pneumophila se
MSIVSLNGASLILAGNCILDRADLQIQPQDRIALVGRNGAGKSTLLKILQGELVLDSGQIQRSSGLRISGLVQEVPGAEGESVYHFLVKSLGETGEVLSQFHEFTQQGDMDKLAKCQQRMDNLNAWHLLPEIETMASRLGIDIHEQMSNLSGGMKRRVLLGAALLARPDLLLLDEPTNHLDVEAIEWLENYLKSFSGAVMVVTHDREFLSQIATSILEIDRGKLYLHHCNYETYLDRRESIRLSEQKQNDLFDKRLAEEEAWIRTGIKARRTRNEGRVRALKAMREQYKARRNQLGTVKSLNLDVSRSGALVVEANKVSYAINDKPIIKDFSLLMTRGDKLGIIGPNGCGKTTLVRLLLGEIKPDAGTIKLGTGLQVAYFDQLRRHLLEDQTVMFNVGEGADYVTINGKQKHVASYLKEFLFSSDRFNQPVSSLSGGERNRLLLAKLFAKPVNLLVMDEPTNDLDIETLELLEAVLADYPGTLILISHDRAFINQVVTSVLVYEGNGKFNEFVGGYDDYKKHQLTRNEQQTKSPVSKRSSPEKAKNLSFNEQRELSKLPQQIEAVEKKIEALHSQMASPEFYQQDAKIISEVTQLLAKEEALLNQYFARWEELEEKK